MPLAGRIEDGVRVVAGAIAVEVVGLTVVMGVATGIVTAACTFPKIVEALSGVRGWRGRLLAKLKR